MKRILFTISLTVLAGYSLAQEKLSLGQCLQMGIERNLNLKTYEGNVLKGKHDISENRSRLLPQINIGAGLNDNFTVRRRSLPSTYPRRSTNSTPCLMRKPGKTSSCR